MLSRRFLKGILSGIFLAAAFPPLLFAAGEIQVDSPVINPNPPDRYEVAATVSNQTTERAEGVLRAQIFFFEESMPMGDLPAMVLRKDETIVLKQGESRQVAVKLINEGTLPKGRLRAVPEMRVRRQRVWSY